MNGPSAICSTCGATGNPKGTPPPMHLRALFKTVLEIVRQQGGPVLIVCAPTVPRSYVLRCMREGDNATEAEINAITFAIPQALPRNGPFKAVFIDQDITDETTRKNCLDLKERPPPPSVWEWLRKPGI